MTDTAYTQEIRDGVATLRLARPETGNKLTAEEVRALGQAIRAAGAQQDVRAVVLRAGGEAFCLGRSPAPPGSAPKTALAIRSGVAEPILSLYADVRATEVPVIAVVQGEARGFGCALVGQCDMAIAADTARFSMPEMETNLPPTLAISAVLGKVPPKRLMHMICTRTQIDAAEALVMGLVSQVAPRAELEQIADATIARVVDRARPALAAVKEYMIASQGLDVSAASRLAANTISVVLASQG